MNMEEAFLQDIIAYPEDDTPRLIYADYLSEHGQEERAEFIRAQIERAKIRCVDDHGQFPGQIVLCEQLRGECRHCDLWRREGKLLATLHGTELRFHFRRGFVWLWRGPCSVWLEHGPALVRAHPLERVELSDATLRDNDIGQVVWAWSSANPLATGCLSEELWDWIPRVTGESAWVNEEDARAALSQGCLAYARNSPEK